MTRLGMAGRLLAVACWMALPSAIADTSAGNATAAASRARAPRSPGPGQFVYARFPLSTMSLLERATRISKVPGSTRHALVATS